MPGKSCCLGALILYDSCSCYPLSAWTVLRLNNRQPFVLVLRNWINEQPRGSESMQLQWTWNIWNVDKFLNQLESHRVTSHPANENSIYRMSHISLSIYGSNSEFPDHGDRESSMYGVRLYIVSAGGKFENLHQGSPTLITSALTIEQSNLFLIKRWRHGWDSASKP